MKKFNSAVVAVAALGALALSSCDTPTGQGAGIGAATGAIIGAAATGDVRRRGGRRGDWCRDGRIDRRGGRGGPERLLQRAPGQLLSVRTADGHGRYPSEPIRPASFGRCARSSTRCARARSGDGTYLPPAVRQTRVAAVCDCRKNQPRVDSGNAGSTRFCFLFPLKWQK